MKWSGKTDIPVQEKELMFRSDDHAGIKKGEE